jgi:Tfp pilus assembly protein PilF
MMKLPHAHAALAVALSTLLLAACGTPPKPPPAPPSGLAELMERPGERALFEGIRAYDDGQYTLAETALRKALAAGLQSGRDRASAHKLLAFITCTSDRLAECEAAFRAARVADPAFALSRSEAGHPQWGPVYRKLVSPSAP